MWKAFVRAGLAVVLTSVGASGARAQNPSITIAVDADADVRPIDPRIYGVNYGSPAGLAGPEVPPEPPGRIPHHAVQLAGQRRQPRRTTTSSRACAVASGSATPRGVRATASSPRPRRRGRSR